MWWIVVFVLLTGSLGLYIVITAFAALFLWEAPWPIWAIMAFFFVLYLLFGGPNKMVKGRRERRMEKKARKELRKRLAIEKEQKRLRDMNHIRVVAAVIHDGNGRIFAAQRGSGDLKGKWEFPGGKIEPGENCEEALKREIREELASEITIERHLDTIKWDYPDSRMTMYCYLCRLKSGKPTLKEHMDGKWLAKKDRFSVDWVPADRCLLFKLGLY
jgi:8-oxo-dGTP diphosphatase